MSNYFVTHRESNLITGVVATTATPQQTSQNLFIKTNDKALDVYYRWISRNVGICPDLGQVLAQSKYLADGLRVSKGKSVPIKENLNQRYREPASAKHEDRETRIKLWINNNPEPDEYELADFFLCGLTVAKAYLAKYQ